MRASDWVFVESPAIQAASPARRPSIVAESSPPDDEAGLDDLLIDQLRDILHAEKQLTKALPKMAEAARFDQLRELFDSISPRPKRRSSVSTSASNCLARSRAPSPARA